MKIAFITTVVYPSPTANRIHTLSMAKAFAKKGLSVDLLCRSISNVDFSSSVKKVEIGTNRSISSAWKYASFLRENKHDVWFVREPHLMLLTILFFLGRTFKVPPYILYEVHDMPRDFFDALSLKILTIFKKYKIIVITNLLKEDLVNKYKLDAERVIVLPDGVDMELFLPDEQDNLLNNEKDQSKPLVVYTGSLFPWKGVYTLIDVAKSSPDLQFWIVGGYKNDIQLVRDAAQGLENVKVWGYVTHNEIRNFLQCADVLVLPNSATYRMSERYTSPLKLFEYMASRKPIVASRLPSIEEILQDGHNGFLVEPDNAEALVEGIKRALSDTQTTSVVVQALLDVEAYSWDRRIEAILTHVS